MKNIRKQFDFKKDFSWGPFPQLQNRFSPPASSFFHSISFPVLDTKIRFQAFKFY